MPLLPSGLQDSLPPHPMQDRHVVNCLLDRFALFGYAQVAPPLAEFEDTLFVGPGTSRVSDSFRVIDPLSQQMMGLRCDITPQIVRVASSILAAQPECDIVRLSYAGQVLRVMPHAMDTKRQLRQAGIEAIGRRKKISEIEMITASLEALQLLGLSSVICSLSIAGWLNVALTACDAPMRDIVIKAVHHKDGSALPLDTPHYDLIIALLSDALSLAHILARDDVPDELRTLLIHLDKVGTEISQRFGRFVECQYDILDNQGFPYHDGVCVTLLDKASSQEIGRGGCYVLDNALYGCGISLLVDRLVEADIALPDMVDSRDISVDMPYDEAKELRDKHIVTLTK